MLDYESAEHDGYSFRAIEVWPASQEPHRADSEIAGDSDAYHSRLTITRHPDASGLG
jgi:CspA family cold shock protein